MRKELSKLDFYNSISCPCIIGLQCEKTPLSFTNEVQYTGAIYDDSTGPLYGYVIIELDDDFSLALPSHIVWKTVWRGQGVPRQDRG